MRGAQLHACVWRASAARAGRSNMAHRVAALAAHLGAAGGGAGAGAPAAAPSPVADPAVPVPLAHRTTHPPYARGAAAPASDGLRQDVAGVAAQHHSLRGYTVLITGASRGIGLAIGMAAARRGANVAILAKTEVADARLPGTIHTAKADIEALRGGRALAVACDIRSEDAVRAAVRAVVEAFGGVDIVVNNASAIALTPTDATPMKRFDLMAAVNVRGTFLVTATCLPFLRASRASGRWPHVLTLAPPLDMEAHWFGPHVAYTIAKYGMSMCTLGWADEFRADGIGVNSLWPRTAIATAAVANVIGGDDMMRRARTPAIVADAAVAILCADPRVVTGNFFLDEDVLRATGATDFSRYKVDAAVPDADIVPDYFIPRAYGGAAATS